MTITSEYRFSKNELKIALTDFLLKMDLLPDTIKTCEIEFEPQGQTLSLWLSREIK